MVDVVNEFRRARSFVAPRYVSDQITGKITKPETVVEALPPEVTERFTSRNGNPKKSRLDRFKKNIRKCLDAGFSFAQLLQMDEGCVDNQGHIKTDRLQRILKGEFDD